MNKTALYVACGLLLATFTGYVAFETFRYTEEKYHDRLHRIAEKVNSMNTTWKAGSNSKWINADIDGVKAHMGVLEGNSGVNLEVKETVANGLPESFDSRD